MQQRAGAARSLRSLSSKAIIARLSAGLGGPAFTMQREVAAALPDEILLYKVLCVICSSLGLRMLDISVSAKVSPASSQGLAGNE